MFTGGYIQQNQQHIKKGETCLTGAGMCLDNICSKPSTRRLQLLILAAAETPDSLERHSRVFGETPTCDRDC